MGTRKGCPYEGMHKNQPHVHRRRSLRLKQYDYSQDGAYFVTLCTVDRRRYFEQSLRQIVDREWSALPGRFPQVRLDEYVIMPNHFHGILMICRDTPCGYPAVSGRVNSALGEIIGAFKSLCVTAWLKVIKTQRLDARAKFWQANYYEHVIRCGRELERIREYIVNNPLQWELDRENPELDRSKDSKPLEKWMV